MARTSTSTTPSPTCCNICCFNRSSTARAAEAVRSSGMVTDTSTDDADPTWRARTRTTSSTSTFSFATCVTFCTNSSLDVSVNCLTDSPNISIPVIPIIAATNNPAAASTNTKPGIDMAIPMEKNAKMDE